MSKKIPVCDECGLFLRDEEQIHYGDFYNVKFCSSLCKSRWQARNPIGEPRSISEICHAAKEAGMTYGQYQTKRYCERLIQKRKEESSGNYETKSIPTV